MDKNTDAAREKAKTDSRGAVIDAGLVLDRTSVPILDIGVNFGFDAGLAAASPAWVRIDGPESLPKEDGEYLVQTFRGKIRVADFYATDDYPQMFYFPYAQFNHHEVAAWQGIAPYHPDSEGEQG